MKKMRKISLLADILFPARCPCCGGIVDFENRLRLLNGTGSYACFVHEKCFRELPFLKDNYCRSCGVPLRKGQSLCPECSSRKRPFDGGRAVFSYETSARDAILQLKYHNRRINAEFFGFAAAAVLSGWLRAISPDVCIPVPVHRKRLRERGYNQAVLLAESIREYTGIPVRTDILCRIKNTEAQKSLSPLERKNNLRDAFRKEAELPAGQTVLLVDDIYTTGATADFCSAVLKKQCGAEKVYLLSICAVPAAEGKGNEN